MIYNPGTTLSHFFVPYVKTYGTLKHLNDDVLTNHVDLLIIVLFSYVGDWSIRHRLNVLVSRRFLNTVQKMR